MAALFPRPTSYSQAQRQAANIYGSIDLNPLARRVDELRDLRQSLFTDPNAATLELGLRQSGDIFRDLDTARADLSETDRLQQEIDDSAARRGLPASEETIQLLANSNPDQGGIEDFYAGFLASQRDQNTEIDRQNAAKKEQIDRTLESYREAVRAATNTTNAVVQASRVNVEADRGRLAAADAVTAAQNNLIESQFKVTDSTQKAAMDAISAQATIAGTESTVLANKGTAALATTFVTATEQIKRNELKVSDGTSLEDYLAKAQESIKRAQDSDASPANIASTIYQISVAARQVVTNTVRQAVLNKNPGLAFGVLGENGKAFDNFINSQYNPIPVYQPFAPEQTKTLPATSTTADQRTQKQANGAGLTLREKRLAEEARGKSQ